MLILGQKNDPRKIVLRKAVKAARGQKAEPEAFVIMSPITSAMRRRASRAARGLLASTGAEDFSKIDDDLLIDAGELGSRELIRLALVEWGGLGDADGNELELTPPQSVRFATANAEDRPTGSIDLLLADEAIVAKIDSDFVRADAIRQSEKNASSASPNGTGAAATRAKDTASSAALPRAKTSAAKNARTANTRSAAKKRKPAGKR